MCARHCLIDDLRHLWKGDAPLTKGEINHLIGGIKYARRVAATIHGGIS